MKQLTYGSLETGCEQLFLSRGPYYHLCSNGTKQAIIFTSSESFIEGMNSVATSVIISKVKIISFVLMNNHIHFILNGRKDDCLLFFNNFKKRLGRVLNTKDFSVDLTNFDSDTLIEITDLNALRTEIAYVDRNPYVDRRDVIPHTYQWGTGHLMFNPLISKIPSIDFNDLTYREKRRIIRGRDIEVSDYKLRCREGMIIPESFCDIQFTQSLYRDASHYYNIINRKQEAYSLIAKRLADPACLTDEELFRIVQSIVKENFNLTSTKSLTPAAKIEVLHLLKKQCVVGNAQIQRVLGLDQSIICRLYPTAQ